MLVVIERKLDEVDKKVKSVSMERGLQKKQLENSLNKNRQEQEQLRARLSQLEEEDRDLTGRINRNNELQAAAEKVSTFEQLHHQFRCDNMYL